MKIKSQIIAVFLLTSFLLACNLPTSSQPTPTPIVETPTPLDVRQIIESTQTIAAAQTQGAATIAAIPSVTQIPVNYLHIVVQGNKLSLWFDRPLKNGSIYYAVSIGNDTPYAEGYLTDHVEINVPFEGSYLKILNEWIAIRSMNETREVRVD